jgi:hypothetical protein
MCSAAHRVFSTWVHSRSLRSPGRLARLAVRPRAVGRQRAMDYVENPAPAAGLLSILRRFIATLRPRPLAFPPLPPCRRTRIRKDHRWTCNNTLTTDISALHRGAKVLQCTKQFNVLGSGDRSSRVVLVPVEWHVRESLELERRDFFCQ